VAAASGFSSLKLFGSEITAAVHLQAHTLRRRTRFHGRIQSQQIGLTNQTILFHSAAMVNAGVKRVLESYPKIYLACHRRHLREDESGRALTQHQASILDHLDPVKPLVLSEIARHMSVTMSTMSINIARLRQAGYVKRTRDREDGRRVCLTLTAAGMRVKEQNSVLDPDLLLDLLSLMTAEDLDAALDGLELLAVAAEKLLNRRPLRRRPA
jgi:MarR family transcriptional regulator, organic hydroperoxide resistance regulator